MLHATMKPISALARRATRLSRRQLPSKGRLASVLAGLPIQVTDTSTKPPSAPSNHLESLTNTESQANRSDQSDLDEIAALLASEEPSIENGPLPLLEDFTQGSSKDLVALSDWRLRAASQQKNSDRAAPWRTKRVEGREKVPVQDTDPRGLSSLRKYRQDHLRLIVG